jgi:transposase-like protein
VKKRRQRHSPEFVSKVVAAKQAGGNATEIAEKYGIRANQIYKWVAAAARGAVAVKGHRSRAAKTKPDSDVEQIVSELLASLRPGLVEVIGKLVDLGVERKLDETRTTVMNALRRAA